MESPLYVARPILPDLSQLNELLEDVWSTRIVTNEGPLHNRLEEELKAYLGVPVAKLFASGTTALICAIRSLGLTEGAEIITTPLTFAATAHAIAFCGYKPVFADVCEQSLTLDPAAVETAISDRTEAVIGVHVYGTLCDVTGLQDVCRRRNLRLIFDAAHAFGSQKDGTSVGMVGDISVFSLHATKLFHTLEGGLITTGNPQLAESIRLIRNFGIASEEQVDMVGINGKMSELHAAIGLLNLPLVEAEIAARAKLRQTYDSMIAGRPGLRSQLTQPGVKLSEQYYPLIIDPEEFGRTRDDIYEEFKAHGIYARRYFWPVCSDFAPYQSEKVHSVQAIPVVDKIKDRVLCLPFHSGVKVNHIENISNIMSK